MSVDADLWGMTDRDRVLLEDVLYLARSVPLHADPGCLPAPVERDVDAPMEVLTDHGVPVALVGGTWEPVAPALDDEGIASGRLAAPIRYPATPAPTSALVDDGIESGRLALPRPVYDPVTRLWRCHCGVDYARMRGVLGCCSRDHRPLPAPEPERLYACDEPGCDRVLATSQALGGHKVSAHGPAHNKQECPHCHGMFDSRGYATHVAAEERAIAVDRRRAEGEARLAALAAETRARLTVEEATASVALDGETQVVGVPDEPDPGPQLSVMLDDDGHDMRAPAADTPPLAPLSIDAKVNAGLRYMDRIARSPSRRTWQMLIELVRSDDVEATIFAWPSVDGGRFRRELSIDGGQRLDEWVADFVAGANGRAAA
jgi:hypothetical protein